MLSDVGSKVWGGNEWRKMTKNHHQRPPNECKLKLVE